MRILFAADVPADPHSGASGTEWQTVAALRRLGHEVEEIWREDLPRRIQHGNLHYLLELPRAYREAIGLRCLVRRYDVVHVNQGHSYLAALEHRERRRRGAFVFRSHGLELRGRGAIDRWRAARGIRARSALKRFPGMLVDAGLLRHERLAVQHATGTIVSSDLDRDHLIGDEGIPESRVACIPQAPPDLFRTTPPRGLDDQRLRKILHVAGFGFVKAPHVVAAAASEALEADPEATFTWVCDEAHHEAVRGLLTPIARERTSLLPWRAQDELLDVYDSHGVFLFPSYFEGFGKAFLEAMARGLCVIATPTGGMLDLIRDGDNGMLVGFEDPGAITARIRYLRQNPEDAHAISASARETASAHTWDRVAAETATFYEQLIELQSRS